MLWGRFATKGHMKERPRKEGGEERRREKGAQKKNDRQGDLIYP